MAERGRRGGRGKRRSTNIEEGREYRLDIASLGPDHRANVLEDSMEITPSSHQRMARAWPVVCPRFIHVLGTCRFQNLRHLQLIVHDSRLLTAMVERWCPMTNTFHLPVGEMTITLQDVAMILGIRIDGPPLIGPVVVGDGLLWDTWEDCCDELLGGHPDPHFPYVDPANPNNVVHFKMGSAETHSLLPLRWLRWTYYRESYEDMTVQQIHFCVRAYILFILGTLLLPDTSHSHVPLQYLPLLEDLDEFSTFSLGSSVLGHLYRELTLATKPKRTYLAGCLHLLQVWCWERVYVGRPTLYTPSDFGVMGKPLGARWSSVGHRELPACSTAMYRDMIDGLQQSQVAWTPYLEGAEMALLPTICFEGIDIWTARVPLISWKRVEWHLPDRVMRQFASGQSLQVQPIPQGFEREDGRGRAGTDWEHHHMAYIALWEDRLQYVTAIRYRGDPEAELGAYLAWYRSWASVFLVQPSTRAPDTYQPSAPSHRLLVDYYHQVQQIAQPFYGGRGEDASSMQLAWDQVGALSESLRQQLYIDPIYQQPGEDVGGYDVSRGDVGGYYEGGGDPGASSSRQPGTADSDDDDFQEPPPPPPPPRQQRRVIRPPTRLTPGSGAIRPRKRR